MGNVVPINIKKDVVLANEKFTKVEGLYKINREDLIFSDEMDDEGTNTSLIMEDYDWASYNLTTRFNTKENGLTRVSFHNFLFNASDMVVTQLKDRKVSYYIISFDTGTFNKYVKRFLIEHANNFDKTYAFDGEEIVVDFFNEVVESGNMILKATTDKDVPNSLSWIAVDDEYAKIRAKIIELNGGNK